MLAHFSEHTFTTRVNQALTHVRTILDNTRNPQYPADVHHEYEDKYLLAEFLSNSAIAAHISVLDFLGVTNKPFAQLKEWAKTRSVSLRFSSVETCKFLRKAVREVESATKHVTTNSTGKKTENYSVTKITEYFWQFTVKWELLVFQGVEHEKGIVLQSRTGTVELKTSVETTPRPESHVNAPLDVNILWLIKNADETRTPTFSINRKSKLCRTPRRNQDVTKALSFFTSYHTWAQNVIKYLSSTFALQPNHGLDTSAITDAGVFVPVLPLFDSPESSESAASTSSSSASSKVPPAYITSFLGEQTRSLEERRKTISKVIPDNEKLITIKEAYLIMYLQHANHISEAYSEGVDYIEEMLTKQLVAAIGKVVTPSDFANYLTFHYRKIFTPAYRPVPFSFAIRRPNHAPEGTLSIASQLSDGSISGSVSTMLSRSHATHPMFFNINESTQISFLGERYLHGFVSHQFAGQSGVSLSLNASARQFSSFILLLGRIVSAEEFDPKYAIIIQNKDDLKIPLLLETIPTPKEFKDAIASLSPEQQRFCKAFRSMQLESTLFGVCVIQIKPQLEKVLQLPEDSLTKEIQLTQDLLEMFIKYQIPSDLLAYDGAEENSVEKKIEKVKEYALRMTDMLNITKSTQLDEAILFDEMREANEPKKSRRSVMRKRDNDVPVSYAAPMGGRMAMMTPIGMPAAYLPPMPYSAPAPTTISPMLFQQQQLLQQQVHLQQLPQQPQQAQQAQAFAQAHAQQHQAYAQAHAQHQAQAQVQSQPQPQNPNKHQLEQWTPTQENTNAQLIDYTKIPGELEAKFENFDENNALRPTIITPKKEWAWTQQKSLLSEPEKRALHKEDQEKERSKAFDLLDALTKSGVLNIVNADLHVVIAATHCFDKSIIQTVVQDNINPIEKIENSSLLIASTIHHTLPITLIAPEHLERITQTSPLLLTDINNNNNNSNEGREKKRRIDTDDMDE